MQDFYAEPRAIEPDPESFGAYRLTTAEVVFADAPGGDSAVLWQDYDLTPGFPRLRAFIERWRDDPVHRVQSVMVTEIGDAWIPACRISPATAAVH